MRYLNVATRAPVRPAAAQALIDAQPFDDVDPDGLSPRAGAAAQLLRDATDSATDLLGAAETVWTASHAEAVHLAIVGTARWAVANGLHHERADIVTSAIEHSAVLHACRFAAQLTGGEVRIAQSDRAGIIETDRAAELFDDRVLLASWHHLNHEVGTGQDTAALAELAHAAGARVHIDGGQAVGQVGLSLGQLGADMVSWQASWFGGPAGVGGLSLASEGRLASLVGGTDDQQGLRSGSLPISHVAATAVALHDAVDNVQAEWSARETTRRALRSALEQVDDVQVHGALGDAHPGIVACSALYVAGDALRAALYAAGYEVSSGSACARDADTPSHVLTAMEALTHGHTRISFGADFTPDDAEAFVHTYAEVVAKLRAEHPIAPAANAQDT